MKPRTRSTIEKETEVPINPTQEKCGLFLGFMRCACGQTWGLSLFDIDRCFRLS
jgi:hypothetical protein